MTTTQFPSNNWSFAGLGVSQNVDCFPLELLRDRYADRNEVEESLLPLFLIQISWFFDLI